jgi:hypothetical protein
MLVLLFVAAFGFTLAMSYRGHQSAPAGMVSANMADAVRMSRKMAKAQPVSPFDPAPAAIVRPHEPTTQQLELIGQLYEQVAVPTEEASMEVREKRGNEIREIANLHGPQATQALVSALRNDSDIRNRLLAVEALHRAGVDGDADWQIRNVLHDVSLSQDEVVAPHARDAYDDLVKRLDAQR